ncbi:MAG: DUF4282 domain-containing protein [Parvularcula sp.]
MSDLIGRFLSFEEHLGRGLVKFAYYLALFFSIVVNLWWLMTAIFGLRLGDAVIILCQAILAIVVLRVVTELALAILSIDDHLQNGGVVNEGFEAGLTPAPRTAKADAAQPAPEPAADHNRGEDAQGAED